MTTSLIPVPNDTDSELFFETIREYETATGLVVSDIRVDVEHQSIFVNSFYTDGTWAGTIACDLPLRKAVAKLSFYVVSVALEDAA